ncbi:restriction endonuclease subunit S [Pseudomonas sp. G.S.17]|uniref:restriction endonuclease subunit S n=1 Tax=Pseudomonas sp. G.S.17 TaxID=3137451 RepID=UPI00311C9327
MTGKYKAYSSIKESNISWLCEIPSHWILNRFKNTFRIKKRIAGKLGFDILSITQKGVKIKDTETGDGQLSMDYSKYQRVYENDFAMNHMDLLTGYVDISKHDGVTSPDYRVFTLEDKNSHKKYFLYLLQLCYTAKIFYPLGQGASNIGRWRLPTEAFNEFVAPFPPLDEQIKIASFLDHETIKIDTLIENNSNSSCC